MSVMTPSRPIPSASSSSKTIKATAKATYPTLAVHRGAIDQTMITTGSPPEAMKRILSALETMGIVVEAEHEYRYRCTRPGRHSDSGDLSLVSVLGNGQRKGSISSARHSEAPTTPSLPHKSDDDSENDFERSFTVDLSTVDEFKKPPTTFLRDIVASRDATSPKPIAIHSPVLAELPPHPPTPDIRIHIPPAIKHSPSPPARPVSQPEIESIPQENRVIPEPIIIPHKPHLLNLPSLPSSVDSDVSVLNAPPNPKLIAYGSRTEDPGEEVRFTTELTRLENLDTTYSLDIRRLKGNLRSYKFLYDTLRERADLQA